MTKTQIRRAKERRNAANEERLMTESKNFSDWRMGLPMHSRVDRLKRRPK